MVPSLCGLLPILQLQNPPPPSPTYMLFQVLLIHNYDKTRYMISLPLQLDPPGKPDHQAIDCPTANFGSPLRGRVNNPLITV